MCIKYHQERREEEKACPSPKELCRYADLGKDPQPQSGNNNNISCKSEQSVLQVEHCLSATTGQWLSLSVVSCRVKWHRLCKGCLYALLTLDVSIWFTELNPWDARKCTRLHFL